MSFPNEVASEATVLLRDFPPSSEPSRRLSPETFIIPVALATKLATQIQVTTLIDLVRKVFCRIWNASHGDPATLPSRGINSPELLCDAPEIAQHFSTVITILGAIEGLVGVSVTFSWLIPSLTGKMHHSNCCVRSIKSCFIAIWKEISPLDRVGRWDHGKLHDTLVTIYAQLAR